MVLILQSCIYSHKKEINLCMPWLTHFLGVCGDVLSVADHHWFDPCPGCVPSDRYCTAGRKQFLAGHYWEFTNRCPDARSCSSLHHHHCHDSGKLHKPPTIFREQIVVLFLKTQWNGLMSVVFFPLLMYFLLKQEVWTEHTEELICLFNQQSLVHAKPMNHDC